MEQSTPILTISGSDIMGESGIQADIKTISALGANALSVVSCITVQNSKGINAMENLPTSLVQNQVTAVMTDFHPKAVKIGLVRDAEVVRMLVGEVAGCRNIVLAPGIFSTDGTLMMDDESIDTFRRYMIPTARLLMLRLRDAEKVLGISIKTDDEMRMAASMLRELGAEWVLLRGSSHVKGMLTTLLFGENDSRFFSSHNTEGWQRHGVAGALSAAITTRLGMGDDMPTAIRNAHDYMHSQVVYAKQKDERQQRPVDIYNAFISLVAGHYTSAHDVAFYADNLCITSRYLSQITDKVVGKTPKQIITDYLMNEAKTYLNNTRLTIQEITCKLGFSSDAMFCKFFKGQERCTPSQYRELPSVSMSQKIEN